MQEKFQVLFHNQQDATAVWVGVSDPLYGEFFWVYGNASTTEPGSTPPNVPATLDQRFDIGSISKTFCGVVMMLLAEQGVFSLSDTVGSLVPDFSTQFPEYEAYQVEDLLRMNTIVADVYSNADMLRVIELEPSLRFSIENLVTFATELPPTNQTGYSSTNILVAEFIIEYITGRTMQDLVQELILTPLGLNNTALPARDSLGIRPEPAATPYVGRLCSATLLDDGLNNVTAAVGSDITNYSQTVVQYGSADSMTSNIADLLHWAKSGTGDSLLSDPMLEKRHIYKNFISSMETYGITQIMFDPKAAAGTGLEGWYGHAGSTFGFTALALKNDGFDGAAIAVAANSCNYGFGHLVDYTTELKGRNGSPIMSPAASPTAGGSTTESPTSSGQCSSLFVWTVAVVLGWLGRQCLYVL